MASFKKRTIRDVPLANTTVLLRADYNVPLTSDGKVGDSYRITQSIPTLRYLLEQSCKIVICSHLGRPEGKHIASMSLASVADVLAKLLGQPVTFVPECVGDQVTQAVKQMKPGSVVLLENLRFHEGEEKDDPQFAARLAKDSTARYFVQDGFGVVHRAHASTEAITQFLPSVSGLLLEKEYVKITSALESPKHPLTIVMGGAKVADKIPLIKRFIEIADTLVIGGAIANTFLKFYSGYNIGKSVYDADAADVVSDIMHTVCKKWCDRSDSCQCDTCEVCSAHLILPTDVAVGKSTNDDAQRLETSLDAVEVDDLILDLGQKSISRIVTVLEESQMVIWNGPLGYAELPQFSYSSNFVAGTLASHHERIKSLIGGGDTADFVLRWAAEQHQDLSVFDHISTGGGASLELMEGKKLPGIEALMNA
jgi:phosphoglycerate kinase